MADRKKGAGYCGSADDFAISSICLHTGEEPVLSGVSGMCNIFFSHCNLQCVYCQNYQISRNDSPETVFPREEVIRRIEQVLAEGAACVGFVSPSHHVPRVTGIMDSLHEKGLDPVFVYNSSAYDNRDVIASLDGRVNVYLPDFKYMDAELAGEYSGAPDYPEVALRALREMFRQKGSNLYLDGNGIAHSGLIIRHLILPGHVENSRLVLRAIAEELSTSVHISLMSQYHPVRPVHGHPVLGRCIKRDEYEAVLDEFHSLGFHRGWVQDYTSRDHYLPDFDKNHPFAGQ